VLFDKMKASPSAYPDLERTDLKGNVLRKRQTPEVIIMSASRKPAWVGQYAITFDSSARSTPYQTLFREIQG